VPRKQSYVFAPGSEAEARRFTTQATLTGEHKINKGHKGPPHKTDSFVPLRADSERWMARFNMAHRYLALT
jgi:hypothetical protein